MKKVTIIIPTYNEEKNIKNCLKSIFAQDYPKKDLQVIIADGGSKDKTREIAKKLGAEVLLKADLTTEETRKPYAIRKKANGEIIGLLDADNIIPNKKDWLKKMVEPFKDKEIFAADTLYYEFRNDDNLTTKYGALIGGDDPIATYLGINDRICFFNNKWTGMPHKSEDKGNYLKVSIRKDKVPALGSNGFFFRKSLFNKVPNNPFIHPIFVYELVNKGHNKMAKVKQGLIHAQDGSMNTFFKKKLRRIQRRLGVSSKKHRFGGGNVEWKYSYDVKKKNIIREALYVATILLPLLDMVKGYKRKPTSAWLFHPVASLGLLFIYAYYAIKST